MSYKNIITKIQETHRRLTGSTIETELTSYQNILSDINNLKFQFENKSDDQLKNASQKLRERARDNESPDNLLAEVFALVREGIRRVLKLHPFDVQLIGGIAMQQGKLAEMRTGEGKTLTAVFPAYLNALWGKGVHVLTFNDYLARRDAKWMGPVYEFLGLSVGFVQEGMDIEERKKAYQLDITYLTAKEAGFDFLRDSLCYEHQHIVHRPFHYAIVDEADSILIDEARVPLIIAGATEDTIADAYRIAHVAQQLEKGSDFDFDEYARNFHLTENGLERVERLFNCRNLYAEQNLELLTRLNCAIHAETLLHRDVDYIVRDKKVELVDEFTGRVADKRRWPDGLQAAIEAKENIDIQFKGNILNSITLQHFLRLYPKLSGMTATAVTAEKEFAEFYKLQIVVIPPNRPCIRKDRQDIIYQTKAAKKQAVIKEIIEVYKTMRPILVGTRSVEESALLAEALEEQGVNCEVLNAKRDEFEAKIVAQAGKLGAVTISTNLAGRGTDIRLGGADEKEKQQVLALGGLYVIGTNKHESRRIDNQLRGRAGRQGDPGSSRFFISLEDDLFVKYKLAELLPSNYSVAKQSGEIDDPFVRREVSRVQRIVDGQNLEIKKNLTTYSHLIEQQRKIVFQKRNEILFDDSVLDFYESESPGHFKQLVSKVDRTQLEAACRRMSLHFLDKFWSQHLAEIADIREGVHLVRLGGEKPVLVFQKLAIDSFDKLQKNLKAEMIRSFNLIKVKDNRIDLDDAGLKAPSSTWTYLINDNPFENMLGVQLLGSAGLQIGAGLWWPLMMLYSLVRRLRRKK